MDFPLILTPAIRNHLLAAGSVEVSTSSSCLLLCSTQRSHRATPFENLSQWIRLRVPKMSSLAPIWNHLPKQMHSICCGIRLKGKTKMLLVLSVWSKDTKTLQTGMLQPLSTGGCWCLVLCNSIEHSASSWAWSKLRAQRLLLLALQATINGPEHAAWAQTCCTGALQVLQDRLAAATARPWARKHLQQQLLLQVF